MCKCSASSTVATLAECRLMLTCDNKIPPWTEASSTRTQHREAATNGWIVVVFSEARGIWRRGSQKVGYPRGGWRCAAGGFACRSAKKVRRGRQRHRDQDRSDHAVQRTGICIRVARTRHERLLQHGQWNHGRHQLTQG